MTVALDDSTSPAPDPPAARRDRTVWDAPDRAAVLDAYALIDTEADPAFDDIARLTAEFLDAPLAFVSLMAGARQWFKAGHGTDIREVSAKDSLCVRLLPAPGLTVVNDLSADPALACNPFVHGEMQLRFYAGVRLDTPDGVPLGSLCVLDTRARPQGLTPSQTTALTALGRQVEAQFELRRRVLESRAVEDALRASQSQLRELNATLEARVAQRTRERDRAWNNAQDLMVITDMDSRIQAVNPAWTKVLGWTEEESIGRRTIDFVHPDHHDASRASLAHLQTAVLRDFENRYIHKDGSTRWVSWLATPDDGLLYAAGRDITVERARQAQLEAVQEQIRQAQKIEAIGQLTGGVAHDFNNLLMVISGGLGLIGRHQDEARHARIMDAMRQATERGAALTRKLLTFARRRALSPQPVNLAHHIEGMRELLDRSLREDIHVQTAFAPDLWPAECDPDELELVLINLCVNARDAMPHGGVITIRAENARPLPTADAGAPLEGEFVRLSVVDDGAGMAAEVRARVFEPFFTTKEVGKGSGLGLAQVHGFAKQSGGEVTVESEEGRGTTVSLFLRRAALAPMAAAASTCPSLTDPAPDRWSAPQVLLVEDDDEVASLVLEMLSQLDYRPVRASDARQALAWLIEGRPFDVVFSDVMMPGGMTGLDLAREIRRRRPELPVVLTSGFAETVREEAEAEAIPLVPKPYTLQSLARALTAATARRRASA